MIIAMERALHQPNALIRAEELQEIVLLGNTFKIFFFHKLFAETFNEDV